MQKSTSSVIFCCLLSMMMLLYSCEKKCPEGFFGEDCEMRMSDKFVGVYEGTVNCGFTDQYTTLEIERDLGAFDINVLMTYPSEFTMKAHVYDDSVFFDEQTIRIPETTGDTSTFNFGYSEGLLKNDTLDFPLVFLTGETNPTKIICQFKINK